MRRTATAGFTLVEVLIALMIVAMGLAALMTAVSGTATASGYLREKSLAQWIALNRIVSVRLNLKDPSQDTQNPDSGELDYANRHWHYDTRYFDTSIPSMRRVVVRVWAGAADTKSNALAESTGFLGRALTPPGGSNVDWTQGSTVAAATLPSATTPAKATPGAPGTNGAVPGPGAPVGGTPQE